MKKLFRIMILVFMCSFFTVIAEGQTNSLEFKAEFAEIQGINNFYYCMFENGKQVLFTDTYPQADNPSDKRWRPAAGEAPAVSWDSIMPSDNKDVGFLFVAPLEGEVRIKGEISFADWILESNLPSSYGDGVRVTIFKNGTKLWDQRILFQSTASYDITTQLQKDDELKFIVNCYGNNYYDSVEWWPSVEYLDVVADDTSTYYSKTNDEITRLLYDEEKNVYSGVDGVSFISETEVLPTDECSMLRRILLLQTGQYRISGTVNPRTGGKGNVVKVYKNNELIWQQLFLSGKEGKIDLQIYVNKYDLIDIECSVNEYTGADYANWNLNVNKTDTIDENFTATTTDGRNYIKVSEKTLSDYIENEENTEFYALRYNRKYPMTYNIQRGGWETNDLKNTFWNRAMEEQGSREPWENQVEDRQQQEICFVSKEKVKSGNFADTCIEITMKENGIINIEGALGIDESSDGELVKIYVNDDVLWSNRVGDERSLRYDEPYGVSYFSNYIDVLANIKAGDVLKFTFNSWKLYPSDTDITDIKISYIEGKILSETTEWKLKNSKFFDVDKKCVYENGVKRSIDIYSENEKTYIKKSEAENLFETDMGEYSEYVLLDDVADASGSEMVKINDNIIVHDGIPVMYTWNELSEINIASSKYVLPTSTSKFGEVQGADDFYYCAFNGGQETLLSLFPRKDNPNDKRWRVSESQPSYVAFDGMAPANDLDIGIMYVAPMSGEVKLTGEISFATWITNNSSVKDTDGDGVQLEILKNDIVIWEKPLGFLKTESHDLTMQVAKGDKIKFIIKSTGTPYYEVVVWWPTVEYITLEDASALKVVKNEIDENGNYVFSCVNTTGETQNLWVFAAKQDIDGRIEKVIFIPISVPAYSVVEETKNGMGLTASDEISKYIWEAGTMRPYKNINGTFVI